jgi:hypothetical protein
MVAAVNLGLTACGRSWPEVRGVADRDFARAPAAIQTVDILPVDVQVWADPRTRARPDYVRQLLEQNSAAFTSAELASRGYQVVADIDWDGAYPAPDGQRYQALTPTEVVETNYALSSYGQAVHLAGDGLLEPYLPHRLGAQTGSDATLYIGGWAYVGKDPSENKVAKGILIGLLVVAVVAVVVIAVASKGEGGDGLGKLLGGAGKAAAGAGKAAGKVASGMAHAVARTGGQLVRGTLRVTNEVVEAMGRADFRGRTNTHIHINTGGATRPNYYRRNDTAHKGRSQMYVEMTLVDNRTGATLWHARQRFLANASKPDQVRTVVRRMLASMPQR